MQRSNRRFDKKVQLLHEIPKYLAHRHSCLEISIPDSLPYFSSQRALIIISPRFLSPIELRGGSGDAAIMRGSCWRGLEIERSITLSF